MSQTKIDVYPLTVQFEDLDASAIVHHPNYLRYCERARCDAMALRGYSFRQCMADGMTFVVAEALIRFHRPALLSEQLYVVSVNAGFKKSSLKVFQVIVKTPPAAAILATPGAVFHLPDALFHAQLRLVHVDVAKGRPLAMGEALCTALGLGSEGPLAEDPRMGDVRLTAEWDSIR